MAAASSLTVLTVQARKPRLDRLATHMTRTNQLGGRHHTGNTSDSTLCGSLPHRQEGLEAAGGANLSLQVHPAPRQAEAGLPAAIQLNCFTSIPCDCELFKFSDNLLCMKERISYADPLPPLPGEEAFLKH